MCGRFALDSDTPTFIRRFNVHQMELTLETHYNVTPGMFLPTIIRKSPNRAVLMKWGLVPHWSKEPTVKFSTINARMENLDSSAVYRVPYSRQRCLIPAIGFYEWAKLSDGSKWPYYFHLNDRQLFGFAGLWDSWKDAEGKEFLSCTIITCPANSIVGKIHQRMPVILKESDEDLWLDTQASKDTLKKLLKPYDDSKMVGIRVSTRVNSPVNDDSRLIEEFHNT